MHEIKWLRPKPGKMHASAVRKESSTQMTAALGEAWCNKMHFSESVGCQGIVCASPRGVRGGQHGSVCHPCLMQTGLSISHQMPKQRLQLVEKWSHSRHHHASLWLQYLPGCVRDTSFFGNLALTEARGLVSPEHMFEPQDKPQLLSDGPQS